jgi:hypothetical protein
MALAKWLSGNGLRNTEKGCNVVLPLIYPCMNSQEDIPIPREKRFRE